jgi:hypothetical protein
MREPTPLLDPREGDSAQARPAEAATDFGSDDDLNLPVWDVVLTFLAVVVFVGFTALMVALV